MDDTLKELARRICCPPNSRQLRDGLTAVMAIQEDGENESWPPSTDEDLKASELMCSASQIALLIPMKSGSQSVTVSFSNTDRKLRVEIFKELTVVVMFKRAHKINKSMERIIRQATRRYGFERVESGLCSDLDQPDKQPAPLSAIRTGAFSQSQEAKTPVTGEYPVVK